MTTYYVSKTGDNTDGLTLLTAKQTIAGGIGLITNPGDLLLINDGVYDEQINNTIPSGSAGSPITIQAIQANQVTLRPTTQAGGSEAVILLSSKSYITFDGIDADAASLPAGDGRVPYEHYPTTCDHIIIKNGTARNGKGTYGSGIDGDLRNSTIQNMLIQNNGTNVPFFAHGIYTTGIGNTIEDNTIIGAFEAGSGIQISSAAGTGSGTIIRNNHIRDCVYSGITLIASSDGALVYNNVIENIYQSSSSPAHGFLIYSTTGVQLFHNTLFNVAQRQVQLITDAANTEIRNNIFYAPAYPGVAQAIVVNPGATGTICQTNLNVGGNGVSDSISETLGSTDPLFSNSAASDFHLQPGSPAIRTGTVLLRIPTDFDNYARNSSAYDIGAHSVPTGTLIAPWIVTT